MTLLQEMDCGQTRQLQKTTKSNLSPKRLKLIREKDLKGTKKEAKSEQKAEKPEQKVEKEIAKDVRPK